MKAVYNFKKIFNDRISIFVEEPSLFLFYKNKFRFFYFTKMILIGK